MSNLKNKQNFSGIIDRFENDKAVVVSGGGVEIIMDRKILPPDAKAGDVVNADMSPDRKKTKQLESKARELLNKILNPKR